MHAEPVDIEWRPSLSIYASEPFLRSAGDQYGWIGGFDDEHGLRCILPYTIVHKGPLRLARFRVETIMIGEPISVDEERDFLDQVVGLLRSQRADAIIPATTNTLFRTYPHGAIAAPYGSFVLDLTKPEDRLWQGLSASHRRKIRLAAKNGVVIKSGVDEHRSTAYRLVRDTFRRSRMGFMSEAEFERFVDGLGDYVRVFVAEHEGTTQGAIVVPFSTYSAYYVYGGTHDNPATGAANLLHWEAIRAFRDLGVRKYDFVGVRIDPDRGSKQEGLMQFKERFGGELLQGFMWKCHLRPLKSALYSVAVRLTRGGDIVDSERHKLLRP